MDWWCPSVNIWLTKVNLCVYVWNLLCNPAIPSSAVFGRIAKQFRLMDWWCPSVNIWLTKVNLCVYVWNLLCNPAIPSSAVFVGRIAKQFRLMDWWCPSVCPSVNIWLTKVNLCVYVWNLLCNSPIPSSAVSCCIKIKIIQIGINKIFTCGAQWTWDTAHGQHVHAYISKANLLKLNLHLRYATDMGYGIWPTCPYV